ncbi:hypothetical protein BsWGS_18443 [Bradybaena similaris]
MLALLRVAVLVCVVLASESDATACPTGWFGESCMYKCNCLNTPTCDVNGECVGRNQCAINFFGPGCQYYDAGKIQYVETVPPDFNKDKTLCIKNTSRSSVSLRFPKDSQPLFWFRITTINSEFLHNFSVTINDNESCYNERHFYVSATELDVTCDTDALLGKLELHGLVAQTLCSVRIIAGRNVALKQQTSQSSTVTIGGAEVLQSFEAVDGDWKTCSRTRDAPEGSSWKVVFNRPQMLYSVVIAKINTEIDTDLSGFLLQTYNEEKHMIEKFREPNRPASNYTVLLKSRQPVSYLKIFRRPLPGSAMYLSLCEVYVFGETLCPDGTYGVYCNKNCTCNEGDICNLATGACAPGCPAGKYGFNCSLDCSIHCYQGKCHNRFGKCIQCGPGYFGDKCDQECANGTYGSGCKSECPLNCLDACDKKTGACTCPVNYVYPLCDDCVPGFYGDNCSLPCPRFCEENICDKVTGYCLACQGVYDGLHCNECLSNYYGPLCYKRCSAYCVNGTCDPENGTCPACTNGYVGPKCVIVSSANEILQKVLISLPVVTILVLLCTMLMFQKRQSCLDDDSDGEETDKSSFSSETSNTPDTSVISIADVTMNQ